MTADLQIDAAKSAAQAVTLSGSNFSELVSAEVTDENEFDKKSVGIIAFSHVLDDINQGALPTLLPYLITAHHLSYEAAAGLVLMTNLVSSMLQPWIGILSDKPSWRLNLAPIGLAMAGLGVGMAGIMPNYNALLFGAAISGIGVAAFHPDAARATNFVSGSKKATGMGVFALGGNVGFALGPIVATACIVAMGVRGTVLLLIPAFVGALILHKHMNSLAATFEKCKRAARNDRHGSRSDRWWPFGFLTLTIVGRSVIFFGFNTFLPLYWMHVLGQTKANGGAALTVFLISSAVGTFIGGKLADRFGSWPVTLVSLIAVPAAIQLFLSMNRADLASLALFPLGLSLSATLSVMMVLGQKYLPTRIGLASGVTLGLAGSIGGLVTPVLGKLADKYGLHTALTTLVAVSIVSVFLACITMLLDRSSERKLAATA
jgi:FSR family fosmidomycin resistance protein-like MFS transporter